MLPYYIRTLCIRVFAKIEESKTKFVIALAKHEAEEPKDGSVPNATKPLCRHVAKGNICIGNTNNKCFYCSHEKLDSIRMLTLPGAKATCIAQTSNVLDVGVFLRLRVMAPSVVVGILALL